MSSVHNKRKQHSEDMAAGIETARKLSEGVTQEQIDQNVATSTAIETGQSVEKVKRNLKKSKSRRYRPALHEEPENADSDKN